MQQRVLHERLHSLDRNLGGSRLTLLLGRHRIDLEGLDQGLAAALERRWGDFVVTDPGVPASHTARFFRGGEGTWLERWSPGEAYRIEALDDEASRLVASYHFALARGGGPRDWKIGITDSPEEPRDRLVENSVRFLAAHLALDAGGFAMHSAGLLREGRAFLFAGPSRAGKSTASKLVANSLGLGDDFGMIVRGDAGWESPAVPFDNTELVQDRPSSGQYPVAGVWRLHHAAETRVESAAGVRATASLTGCAAFAWAMPERADELLDHVRRFVDQGRFHHLFFTRDAELWPHLANSAGV